MPPGTMGRHQLDGLDLHQPNSEASHIQAGRALTDRRLWDVL